MEKKPVDSLVVKSVQDQKPADIDDSPVLFICAKTLDFYKDKENMGKFWTMARDCESDLEGGAILSPSSILVVANNYFLMQKKYEWRQFFFGTVATSVVGFFGVGAVTSIGGDKFGLLEVAKIFQTLFPEDGGSFIRSPLMKNIFKASLVTKLYCKLASQSLCIIFTYKISNLTNLNSIPIRICLWAPIESHTPLVIIYQKLQSQQLNSTSPSQCSEYKEIQKLKKSKAD